MEIEIIPNTDLYEKDVKKFKMIKKTNGEINYFVTLVNKGGRCKNCSTYTTKCKDLVEKRIVHDKDMIIYYKARRFICACGRTFYEENPFIKDEKILSENVVKRILEELKRYNHTFLEVAERFKISVTKIIEVFDTRVQIKRKALREVISIDEFYFSRRSKNKYAFMVLGLNGEILDIQKTRKKSKLLDYFKYIPLEERNRVKYVTMDMNEVYKDVILRRFKNITICIDSFHVIKMMYDELDRNRKKIMNRYKDKIYLEEYHLLKHHKNVLFKENPDEEFKYSKFFHCYMNEVDYLNRILKIDSELTKTYEEIKRYYYFNHYWNDYTREEALEYLNKYINSCFLSNNQYLIKIGSTLDNWKEYIANSFIPYIKHNGEITRLSNGKIEGKNSYIK